MNDLIKFFVSILVYIKILTPIRLAKLKFLYSCHKWPNFKQPKDINEKINWQKFYGDTSRWSELADKYAVRKHIENMGLKDHLINLLGKWDHPENIDWDKLPNQFILKGNAGSGDSFICRDKSKIDKNEVIHFFSKEQKRTFGLVSAEPHYAKIKPCIIAEELLDSSTQPCNSSSLIDYKIWCFNGKPLYVWCCSNRTSHSVNVGLYDMNWIYHPKKSVFSNHYKEAEILIPRPICFEKMKEIASLLSLGFPQVRIDLYEVNGRVYFGEYTFSSYAGFMNYFSHDFLNELGQLTILPIDK